MEFRPPKVKRSVRWQANPTCQYPATLEKLTQCAGKSIIGKYNGSNVVVDDPNFTLAIYSLGCFGKGSLSRSEPNYFKRKSELKNKPSNVNKNNEHVQHDDSTSTSNLEENMNAKVDGIVGSKTGDTGVENQSSETPVLSSCDSETSAAHETFQHQETLNLNLEEAYFLSYCLGCLCIVDLFDKGLSLLEAWKLFCESQDDFVQKYVVYHHYRSKGWVVKPGLKFGGDFVLYKFGPRITHASYIVIIEVIKKNGNISEEHQQPLTWGRFISLNRMAETAGKEVVLCRVVWPNDVLFNDVQSPEDLKKFNIVEVMTRRWISSQERELFDEEEIGK